MRWRNPKAELPEDQQIVFIMLEPHKDRGGLSKSVESIQIVCGQWLRYEHLEGKPQHYNPHMKYPKGYGRIENWDEYGLGSQAWSFCCQVEDYSRDNAIAWIPAEEMPLPAL